MKKLILIISLLFLLGCIGGGREFAPNFHTGTKGLTLEFLDNAPPDELWYVKDVESSQFLIGIGLRNEGAEDIRRISDNKIVVFSFKDYIKFIKGENCKVYENIADCNIQDIKGKSFAFPEGEFFPLYIDVELDKEELEDKTLEGLDEFIDHIGVEANYNYKTTASVDVCVNDIKEVFELEKSCSAKTETLSGQGAPVAVTQVEYRTSKSTDEKNKLVFDITFEDKGDEEEGIGSIFSTKDDVNVIELEDISFSIYSTDIGNMEPIEGISNQERKIDCIGSKDNKIKIKKSKTEEDENKITCWADVFKESAYLTPLIIEFSYTYHTTEKKIVKIKKFVGEKIEGLTAPPAKIEEGPLVKIPPGGFLVAVDAGHGSYPNDLTGTGPGKDLGGSSAGASAQDLSGKRQYEYKINWIIAEKLITKLNNKGITAFRTRDSMPNVVFTPRINNIMTRGGRPADLVISIHGNGNKYESAKGTWVIYNTGKSNTKESKKFGNYLLNSLKVHGEELGYENEDILLTTQASTTHTSLSILTGNDRDGYPPAVLIETGFLTNKEDITKLIDPAHQDLLVDIIIKAIMNYMGHLT